MATAANRGKSAESTIKKVLTELNDRNANFTFNRVPDAHAAGGRMAPQAGDFQAFCKLNPRGFVVLGVDEGAVLKDMQIRGPAALLEITRNFIIEVKEVKHDYRLPHKNYSEDKVSRVQKRVWAGTEAVVAVLHTTTGAWRLVPFEVFTQRAGGSWDLSPFPVVESIHQALADFMGVRA